MTTATLPLPTRLAPGPSVSGVLALLGLLMLTACAERPTTSARPPGPEVAAPHPLSYPAPQPRPNAALRAARAKRAADAAALAAHAANTPASQTMHGYYTGVEDMLVARGQLRRDDGRAIPVSADLLSRDFIDIALYDEYSRRGADLIADTRPSRLRRWAQPVRIAVEFGASVPPGTRIRDRAEVQAFAERLAGLTGHDIAATPTAGNFTVMFVNEDERRKIGPRLSRIIPGIPPGDIEAIQALPPQNYCTVFAYSLGPSPLYSEAVAIIRAELPPRLRTSCIHEELAQGMGLANDSPTARPSIFNDDEEFALLTNHDALLLQMLYDQRLTPGMTAETATPVVRTIAGELAP